MRLVDLEPRWYGLGLRHGLGLTFLCPKCGNHRLAVPFANPLDGGASEPNSNGCAWQRTGNTFETLTLTPSVDMTRDKPDCWHGHITNGEIK